MSDAKKSSRFSAGMHEAMGSRKWTKPSRDIGCSRYQQYLAATAADGRMLRIGAG